MDKLKQKCPIIEAKFEAKVMEMKRVKKHGENYTFTDEDYKNVQTLVDLIVGTRMDVLVYGMLTLAKNKPPKGTRHSDVIDHVRKVFTDEFSFAKTMGLDTRTISEILNEQKVVRQMVDKVKLYQSGCGMKCPNAERGKL